MAGDMLASAILVIIVGVGSRWLSCYAVMGIEGKFTKSERVLMASAWIPKATV